jgi:hypothetical protein
MSVEFVACVAKKVTDIVEALLNVILPLDEL